MPASARAKLAEAFEPELCATFRQILEEQRDEVMRAIRRGAARSVRAVSYDWMRELVKGLYRDTWADVPVRLRKQIEEMAQRARAQAFAEIGLIDATTPEYERFVEDYVRQSAKRLNGRSYGQLMRVIDKAEGEGRNPSQALENRMRDWGTIRAGREAQEEATRIACAVAGQIFLDNGYEAVWAANSKCCELCRKRDGVAIRTGEHFADEGDGFGGLKKHPPLHKGCKCTIRAGQKFEKALPDDEKNGTIRPTKVLYGHARVASEDEPNAVIDVVGERGGISRYFYDGQGRVSRHVDNGDHGHPKYHPFANGWHVNEAIWADGEHMGFGAPKALTEALLRMCADILRGG